MRPTCLEHLNLGDVLHQPAFGFATVQGLDADGVTLKWERPGSVHPRRVRADGLVDAYRVCHPQGLLALSVREPVAARLLAESEPVDALAMLLAETGEPLKKEDAHDWFVGRRLVGEPRFDAWWDALQPVIEQDPRFAQVRGVWSLAEPIAVDEAARVEHPLGPPGSVPPDAALAYARTLARSLAAVHASGAGMVPSRDAVRFVGADAHFRTRGAPTATGRRDDVRFVMHLVLDQAAGPLPSPADLADDDLCSLISCVAPALPPELLAVALDSLAEDAALRPADGFALLERLTMAERARDLRNEVGWARLATAIAGFDSHIGILKSLHAQTNQDAFVLLGEPTGSLACVFDGISQCTVGSGDLASGLSARAARAWWSDHADAVLAEGGDPDAFLAGLLEHANALVCEASTRLAGGDLDEVVPMGTTAVCALTIGNRVHFAALGDSRAYLVGRHGVAPLTADQNVFSLRLREAVAGGPVDWREPGNALVGYLGHWGDAGEPALPPVFTRTFDLLPGEWLVLCSDGLTDYAATEEAAVARIVTTSIEGARAMAPPAMAMDVCRRLVDAANRGGGGDNIMVLALTLSSDYGSPPQVR